MVTITQVQPTAGTLVSRAYTNADYRDAFDADEDSPTFATIDDFATAYFLGQPKWLTRVSMNLSSRDSVIAALGDRTYPPGSNVGSWAVHDRTENEILFGEEMGFMSYRFSFLRRPEGGIQVSSAVEYRSRAMGRAYFALVKPLHRRFVARSVRSAFRQAVMATS